MYSVGKLEITGYRAQPLPNTFFRQDEETDRIVVVFPGYGYRCYMPLLYYPTRVLLSLGADVLWVEYAYDKQSEFQKLQSSERMEWLFSDSTAGMRVASKQRSYQRITLIGESLGTLAIGRLLGADFSLARADVVWLTPLLTNPELRTQLEKLSNPSLFIIGSADEEYDSAFVAKLRKKSGAKFIVPKDADHSLEAGNDVVRSIEILRQVMEAIHKFVLA